jgi:hypothetical protein
VGQADRLPRALRTRIFARAGAREGVWPERIDEVSGDAIAAWLAALPPRRRYPAVAIGSSSGALMHLCAALGIPWLPQTVLVPVRRSHPGDPDDARLSLETGTPLGERLLARNPDLQLHHMHDPNQDRLMVSHMMYFRLKWRRLPDAYRQFLDDCLEPGGTVLVARCAQSWETLRLGERHVFQHGAVGGATEQEFHEGSPRVAALLERLGSPRRRWEPVPTDEVMPEAEWGFAPSLGADVEAFAAQRKLRVEWLDFAEPDELSPPVADLYRDWHRRRGLPDDRLLVESFILQDPFRCQQLGLVPFWMTFNMEPSAAALEQFLRTRGPFREILLTLFAHGVDSVGLPAIERWRSLLEQALGDGRFVGVDQRAYPAHFAVFARFGSELARLAGARPLPRPLPLAPTLARLRRAMGQDPDNAGAAMREPPASADAAPILLSS